MKERRHNQKPVCVFCGKPATTRDHVPPKGIFLKPRPSNLITVPSCQSCNNGASAWDEGFRNIISMRPGGDTPDAVTLWKQKALPSLRRNRPEMERLRKTMRDVPVAAQDGRILGHVTLVNFDATAHDRTIERITRGLYFHHYGERLPPDCPFEVYFIRDGVDWVSSLADFLAHTRTWDIGGPDVFEYRFGRAAGKPEGSIWFYRFYQGHVAAAVTGHLDVQSPEGDHLH